jgi:hypothetical protein
VHPVHDRVLELVRDPDGACFETLALEVFAHQFELCEPYRHFCAARGKSPAGIRDWRDIPAVPIEAFKHAMLCCGPAERAFLSTGTTQGPERRSHHAIPDLRLYRAAAVAGMRRFLFPDVERMPILSLVPRALERPESSLAQMVAWAIEDFGSPESDYAIRGTEIDVERCGEALRQSEVSGVPLCLMTTTGALIRLLDALSRRRLAFRLPHGSRLMDTGGDKGAPRPLSRNGLLHACWSAFAIPGYFCVNEYGMTELSSQYYDNVIAERYAGRHRARSKAAPPWLRSIVLDPATLRPLAAGEPGLLCHFDLANAGTAMAILTEDMGRIDGDGLELLGRVSGAEARGCSLVFDEWLGAGADARA